MKNFIFKSSDADLQKMFQLIETKLEVQSSNILYCTHQLDNIRNSLKSLVNDMALQKHVDDFYETSPQTERGTPEDLD